MGKHGESVVVGQILTRERDRERRRGKEPSGLGDKKELGFFVSVLSCLFAEDV